MTPFAAQPKTGYKTEAYTTFRPRNWKNVVTYKLLTIRGGMRHVEQMDSDDIVHLLLLMKCDKIKL